MRANISHINRDVADNGPKSWGPYEGKNLAKVDALPDIIVKIPK